MKVDSYKICDVCRRELPVLGNRCRSGDTAVYTFKRTVWRFFSGRLSWGQDDKQLKELCGDCWQDMLKWAEQRRET